MQKEITQIDIAIIGGGIVGLWCAYEILSQKKDLSVVIFEKEMFLGEHTSSRNSEVLHAGLYYEENSLKHLLCLEGNALWRDFVSLHQISFLDSGKLVVSSEANCPQLERLYQNARKNQVSKLESLTQTQIMNLQKTLKIKSGFSSNNSGVLNVAEAINKLKCLIESLGGIILKQQIAQMLEFGPEDFTFSAGTETINSKILVNAGGLFAIDFRRQFGLQDLHNKFVKGSYLLLKKNLNLHKLIYPIPPAHGLGLGVHLTLDTSGKQKFGPNTELVETLDYSVSPYLKKEMYPEIQKLFFSILPEDLVPGYAGIRPKIVDCSNKLVKDFIFNSPSEHQIQGYYEFLGIESPGITAAPALARLLCKKLTI